MDEIWDRMRRQGQRDAVREWREKELGIEPITEYERGRRDGAAEARERDAKLCEAAAKPYHIRANRSVEFSNRQRFNRALATALRDVADAIRNEEVSGD